MVNSFSLPKNLYGGGEDQLQTNYCGRKIPKSMYLSGTEWNFPDGPVLAGNFMSQNATTIKK
jgi:hypothetical protein